MPKIFVRHVRAVADHLDEAMRRLRSLELEEAIVCLRCCKAEIAAARTRPGICGLEALYLDEIEHAATDSEQWIRDAMNSEAPGRW